MLVDQVEPDAVTCLVTLLVTLLRAVTLRVPEVSVVPLTWTAV
jgi:hypothetical protein